MTVENGQAPNTTTTTTTAPSTSADPTSSTVTDNAPGEPSGIDALSAEDLRRIVGDLRKENAKHRTKAKDEADARVAALEASGRFEELAQERHKLLESSNKTIRDLESRAAKLEADAKRWREFEKSETKRIAEAAAELSEDDRALLDSVPDLSARAALLSRLQGQVSVPKADEPPNVDPAGGSGEDPQVEDLIKQGWSREKIRATYPELYEAYLDGGTPKRGTSLARLLTGRA